MKLITWNCNMAFRKKAEYILPFQPDILVVPECEHPDKLKFSHGIRLPDNIFWFGDNQHKGLGVFSYGNFKFELHPSHNDMLKTILPLTVKRKGRHFRLFAVWANNPNDPDGCYVTQTWKALHHYDALLKNKRTILIGDFNSNTIWDKPRRADNHTTVVERLMAKKIHSTYHHFYNQAQGKELHPTFFLYRHLDKPYHMDYCFTSADLTSKIKDVQVGAYENWRNWSDHAPLMVTIDI